MAVAMLATILLAPAAAFAAPVSSSGVAADDTATGSERTASNPFTIAKGNHELSGTATALPYTISVVSQFRCTTYAPLSLYWMDFYCTIFTGAIQIYVECTNPLIAGWSPVLRAPGTYLLRATCGPPASVRTDRIFVRDA